MANSFSPVIHNQIVVTDEVLKFFVPFFCPLQSFDCPPSKEGCWTFKSPCLYTETNIIMFQEAVQTMTKKERIKAIAEGKKADKIPYSFWSHLPMIDLDPVALTEKTYEFYKKYDRDYIKTMNNGMYAIEDFGCEIDYSEIETGSVSKVVKTPIHCVEDWYNLKPTSIYSGSLARELKHLSLLLKKVQNEDVPVVFTVFSPLTTANKLSGNTLKKYIEDGHKEAVHRALKVITETTCELVKAVMDLGADGIFFATQNSNYDFMTEEEYREFGVKYDMDVLSTAKNGWMNVLHAHGNNIMVNILKDYPVTFFNWHAWETAPEVSDAYEITGKCLMGGLNRTDITKCNRENIRTQIRECCRITEGKHLLLTPGCVIRYPLDEDMLNYIKTTKEEIDKEMGIAD